MSALGSQNVDRQCRPTMSVIIVSAVNAGPCVAGLTGFSHSVCSTKQNVGGNCSLFSALHRNVLRKRRHLRNMEPSESRKKITILENLQNSREFPLGILGTVIPGNSRTGITSSPADLEYAVSAYNQR